MTPPVLIFSLGLSLKKIRSIIPLEICFLPVGDFFDHDIKIIDRIYSKYNNNLCIMLLWAYRPVPVGDIDAAPSRD
jgi:hypothetical protein